MILFSVSVTIIIIFAYVMLVIEISVFVLFILLWRQAVKKKKESVLKTAERQYEINKKIMQQLNDGNFKQTKIIYLNDCVAFDRGNGCKKFIAIDNENKKICFVDYRKEAPLIVDFAEILNYEIYDNSEKRIFGYAPAGNYGDFGFGILGASTEGRCNELRLIIRLNRYDVSQICYDIVFDVRDLWTTHEKKTTLWNKMLNWKCFYVNVGKASLCYKQCIATLQEAVSFLEVVKSENSKK